MTRMKHRTAARAGRQTGQPVISRFGYSGGTLLRTHTCAECFGVRSHYAESFFCAVCERRLFNNRYKQFLHAEKTRNGALAKRRAREANANA